MTSATSTSRGAPGGRRASLLRLVSARLELQLAMAERSRLYGRRYMSDPPPIDTRERLDASIDELWQRVRRIEAEVRCGPRGRLLQRARVERQLEDDAPLAHPGRVAV